MPLAAAIVPAVIGGVTSLVAGHEQSSAAKSAAQLQAEEAAKSLAFQEKEFDTTQANEAPFIKAGQNAVTTLSDLLKNGGFPAWTSTFQAPTDVTDQNDPGYKFRLQQGRDALTNSAAASGNLLTGNTGEALQQYGQDFASNEYQNVYNRALQQYQTNFNTFNTNQNNLFNRYASLAGLGQTSTAQLGQVGQQAANNVAGINSTAGAQIGANVNNAAYQQASGYVNAGNAIGGIPGNLTLQALLAQMQKNNQQGSANGGFSPSPIYDDNGNLIS